MHYTSGPQHTDDDRAADREERRHALLRGLGAAVRARRNECGLTLRLLARRAQVSERFLVQLETGEGNISVARLQDVAEALETTSAELLTKAERGKLPPRRLVALLGLRGAGKSTVGAMVAKELGVPFLELDAIIAAEAGMSLSTLFEIHGEAYFRRLERDTLRKLLGEVHSAILATGGSIVNDRATFAMLKQQTCTVWLKATPQNHWDRVVAQGDVRPMNNRANAMSELHALLESRKAFYAQAEYTVDTAEMPLPDVVHRVLLAVARDRRRDSKRGAAAHGPGPPGGSPAKRATKTPPSPRPARARSPAISKDAAASAVKTKRNDIR